MIDEKLLLEKIKNVIPLEAACLVEEAIEEMPKIGEWIPCSEKMPEKEWQTYITTHEDGSVQIHSYVREHGFVFNWDIHKPRSEVVAWMPLPEPMKVE